MGQKAATSSSLSCHTCGVANIKLLRCRGCRQVVYCSVPCQQVDWKQQHKRFCRSFVALQQLTLSAPLDTIEHDYELAKRSVVEIGNVLEQKKMKDQSDRDSAKRRKEQQKENQKSENPHQQRSQGEVKADQAESSGLLPSSSTVDIALRSSPETSFITEDHSTSPCRIASTVDWQLTIEDMPHLGCLQIVMRLNPPWQQRSAQLQAKIESLGQEQSKVWLSCANAGGPTPLPILIPRRLDALSVRGYVMGADGTLSIRLGYRREPSCDPVDDTLETSPPLIPPSDMKDVCCKGCGWRVLKSDAFIERVLPMPSPGRWDDMQDYLVCYEGLATFDFEKMSSLREDSVLEDTTMLVVHSNRTTVCPLHVLDYGRDPSSITSTFNMMDGDALVRGKRPWHQGSAAIGEGDCSTVSCAQCGQVLGFGNQSSSVRIYKHLLATQQQARHDGALQQVITFVTHELVRYAETKAIFTFAVLSPMGHCMYIRLVSWDSFSGIPSPASSDGSIEFIQWYRTAKLLFEVTEQKIGSVDDASANESIWLWTEVDWCCPPGQSKQNSSTATKPPGAQDTSMVEMFLEQEEWSQLVEEMDEGRALISEDVRLATISAKLGRATHSNERIGLAAVLLI